MSKGAIEEADPKTPGFYGHLFVVPKRSGGFRPVLDLSTLNTFLTRKKFRMETASLVRQSIHKGDWATSLDLKDAYFHLLIHPRFRKWLRFVNGNRVFQFKALPFGLSLAPWIFTRVTRELCANVRRRGIRLRVYLDDWLILAASEALCSQHTLLLEDLSLSLGFIFHPEKCSLTPSQQFSFLGMSFDSVKWIVSPSPERIERFIELRDTLMSQESASARSLAALLGQMESLSPLLPLGRLHKRPLQRQLKLRWNQTTDSWDELVSLVGWFKEAISQWMDIKWLTRGVPISLPTPQQELYTDASVVGWGAHFEEHSASGTWSPIQKSWHINLLEMQAVLEAIQALLPHLSSRAILLCTDNTTVACYINKQGGSRSTSLSLKAEAILQLCQIQEIRIAARHVPGKVNILADFLSRPHMVLQTEWTITHNSLEPVWRVWGKPLIDLFATRFNNRLPLFVSPVTDPLAWKVDALSLSWEGLTAYAFPPIPILSKVVRKARLESPRMILIAPDWPAQPWYPDLINLSHVPPLKLHLGKKSLVQPRSGIPHGNPVALDLHAWLLCETNCSHRGCPQEL